MLKDVFGSTISAALTAETTKKLTSSIASYVDRNSEILLTMDLSTRYSFGDNDRAVLFDATHVPQAQLEQEIKASKSIYSGNKIQSNSFYILSVLTASEYLKRKDEKMAILVLTYASLNMYTSLHKGFFKYDANKQVMDYTIAHLDNTFMIRNFPSLFAFIQDNTTTVVNTYRDRIIRCNDDDITWVVDSMWTRLKGKLKKISNKFYENHKKGNYLNSDTDSYDEESFREIDNVSFDIDRLTNKVYVKLINRQYDKRFIRNSIIKADTSYNKLVKLIEDIIDSDGGDGSLRPLISAMIEFYLLQSGKPIQYIGKGDFIAFMKVAYGSNTDTKQMIFIKSTIDRWLAENMYKYGKAKYGKTVQIEYRRAIYMFMVFMINYEAKLQ